MSYHHPIHAETWFYDEQDETELAAHGIRVEEVQQVWSNGAAWAANKKHRAGDFYMFGRTDGGRKLTLVIRWHSTLLAIEPITGWDATEGEIRRYF